MQKCFHREPLLQDTSNQAWQQITDFAIVGDSALRFVGTGFVLSVVGTESDQPYQQVSRQRRSDCGIRNLQYRIQLLLFPVHDASL